MNTKKILIVVSNPAVSTTLGWPVGFWASELIHPYYAFMEKGYEITISSPDGGKVVPDAYSDPRDESGYSADDTLSKKYLNNPDFTTLLEDTPSITSLNKNNFDAILVAGGQAPMFTFEAATRLHEMFSEFYASGKPTAALCHGTAVLRWAKDKNGKPVVDGKEVTGFTNKEEDQADAQVGQKVMPWRIEDELKRLGAHFVQAETWQPFAVQDKNLITGQQQYSGAETAKLVIQSLEV